MQADQEIPTIKKLSLRHSFLNPDATAKAPPFTNTILKASTKRWNQVNLGYFDPHLNKVHGGGKIVSMDKDVCYRNMIFFV